MNLINQKAVKNTFTQIFIRNLAVVILISLLLVKSALTFSEKPAHTDAADQENSFLISLGYHTHPHFHVNTPSASQSSLTVLEKTEDVKDEDANAFYTYVSNTYKNYSDAETSLLRFITILENRQTVSLYILHHSWKGFIS
jgi:hypothetical protein